MDRQTLAHVSRRLASMLVVLPALTAGLLAAEPGLEAAAITYGQETEAPLAGIGRSRDFIDWDGDGLLDLVMLIHPRYTGPDVNTACSKLVLVRNIGSKASPLFEPAEQARTLLHHADLGYHFAFIDFDGDGTQEAVSVKENVVRVFVPLDSGDRWRSFEAAGEDGEALRLALDAHENSPTIGVFDWDGDGREDLLLGANRPKIMKRGFGTGLETHQPLAARVYFAKNITTGKKPAFADPVVLAADGSEIESFGFVYPAAGDLNADGLPELILGEHRPGIRVYENVGERGRPELTYAGVLRGESDAAIATSLAFQVRAADLDGDDRAELVTTSYYGSPSLMLRLRQRRGSDTH